MKTYSYEAKLENGIPTLTETDIESIIHRNLDRKNGFTRETILSNLKTLQADYSEHTKPKPVKSNDHQPCPQCGSIDFLRTGTCFVCLNCQTSQGCS